MRKLLLFIGLATVGIWGCQSESSNMKPLDLLPYGVPVTINTPSETPTVKQGDGFLGDKEVTVKVDNDFDILIAHTAATSSDIALLKAEQISNVKDISTFSRIVEEKANGFIYETQVDSSNVFYGFRMIHLQGDREYVFQSGLMGAYSLEAVQNMYAAVAQ